MTKEEAIKIINCYDIGFYDLSGEKIPADKLAEAFDMAIEALQRTSNAFPTHECVKPTHECISREDAMMEARPEYLNPNQKGHEEYNKAWNDAIEAYWNGLKELPSEPVGISDNIEEMLQRFAQIMRNLEDMKILLSQRTGHWIHDTHFGLNLPEHKCSECGTWEYSDEESNFCPHCGADMRSKIVGKHADFMMIDEAVAKGADDE